MSVVERWLPFMFKRKEAEEKQSEPKSTGLERTQGRPELMWPPALLGQWMRPFFDDPVFTESRGAFGDLTGGLGTSPPHGSLRRWTSPTRRMP